MIPPLLRDPPDQPLPDPSENAEWYGEIWVKYPVNQNLSPSYFGHVFKARSRFRVIMNEACHIAYTKGSTMTLGQAGELYSRLRRWLEGCRNAPAENDRTSWTLATTVSSHISITRADSVNASSKNLTPTWSLVQRLLRNLVTTAYTTTT